MSDKRQQEKSSVALSIFETSSNIETNTTTPPVKPPTFPPHSSLPSLMAWPEWS